MCAAVPCFRSWHVQLPAGCFVMLVSAVVLSMCCCRHWWRIHAALLHHKTRLPIDAWVTSRCARLFVLFDSPIFATIRAVTVHQQSDGWITSGDAPPRYVHERSPSASLSETAKAPKPYHVQDAACSAACAAMRSMNSLLMA
jgi:hypothetical protein